MAKDNTNHPDEWLNNNDKSMCYYQLPNTVEIPTSNTVNFVEMETSELAQPVSQQKLASLMPRGTRVDSTGKRIQVRGARNYTSQSIHISRDEVFDDIVVRGLRAEGLSTKFGVKNNKGGITKLLMELFDKDERQPVIENHFKTQRQKSNCAKTIFSTMTHEELQIIKAETFPSRIDVQVRDYIIKTFANNIDKLRSTIQVLEQVQHVFKMLTPQTEFLSTHNFLTRGFFLDITLMTCSFLTQIIQDSEKCSTEKIQQQQKMEKPLEVHEQQQNKFNEKEVKTAAEILLSVGNDVQSEDTQQNIPFQIIAKEAGSDNTIQPQHTVIIDKNDVEYNCEDSQWTTVEMVDAEGNTKYMLIKAENEANILQILQSQGFQEDNSGTTHVLSNVELIQDPNRQNTENEQQNLPEMLNLSQTKTTVTTEDVSLNQKDLQDTMAEIKQLIQSDDKDISTTQSDSFSSNMSIIQFDEGMMFKHSLPQISTEDEIHDNKRFKSS